MWEKIKLSQISSGVLLFDLPVLTSIEKDIPFRKFPYCILMTQACDVKSHYEVLELYRNNGGDINRQYVSQLLFCPAFDEDLFFKGEHLLEQFNIKLKTIDEKVFRSIKGQKDIRYQYIETNLDSTIPNLIVDFKQYFTLTFQLFESFFNEGDYYQLNHLYYTQLSDRFAHYLQRVAIP